VISPGCTNCYAMREAGGRLRSSPKFAGLTQPSKAGPVWTGEGRLWEEGLAQPGRWQEPRMIFVNSMSGLFSESVPDELIDRIFAVMALAPQHTFQVLTKRAGRMRDYFRSWPMTNNEPDRIVPIASEIAWHIRGQRGQAGVCERPLPNVWLGVSV